MERRFRRVGKPVEDGSLIAILDHQSGVCEPREIGALAPAVGREATASPMTTTNTEQRLNSVVDGMGV